MWFNIFILVELYFNSDNLKFDIHFLLNPNTLHQHFD